MSNATIEGSVTTRPWTVDASHTEVEFSVRHLMLSNVKGRFSDVSGSVEFDPKNPSSLKLDVTIPIATIDTRQGQRDTHLRSADFFDAERHPTMTFKGKRIIGDPMDGFQLVGDLTIRGTTREITLDVTTEGSGIDPWGNERIGYSATGKLDRKEFGLIWNQVLEAGGVAVGDTVKIIINTEIMRPKN
ncbi:MAG TPA: YceI family protein [Gemmatimonadales bacterium]|jgi:polyisoprenoid-binding protein YceI